MKRVLLLLAQGFEIYEAAVFIDVIGWNREDGDHSTELFTCALRKEITSSFKQRFMVDYLVDEIEVNSFDALAIPGGFESYGFYEDAYHPDFLALIKAFKSQGKMIATVCVGALPVGKSGILTGKSGTVYHSEVRREALRSFGVEVLHQPIVEDGNVITSWNPATAMEVAFMLLEKLTDRQNANQIRLLMGFNVDSCSKEQ